MNSHRKYFAAGMLVLGRHTAHATAIKQNGHAVCEASYEKLVMRSVNYAVRSQAEL